MKIAHQNGGIVCILSYLDFLLTDFAAFNSRVFLKYIS